MDAALSKLSELMPSTSSRSFFSQSASQMDAPPSQIPKKKKKKDKKEKKMKSKDEKKNSKKRLQFVANKAPSSLQLSLASLSSLPSRQPQNTGFSASQPQPTRNDKLQEPRPSKQTLWTGPQIDVERSNAVGNSASSSTALLTDPLTAQLAKILQRLE